MDNNTNNNDSGNNNESNNIIVVGGMAFSTTFKRNKPAPCSFFSNTIINKSNNNNNSNLSPSSSSTKQLRKKEEEINKNNNKLVKRNKKKDKKKDKKNYIEQLNNGTFDNNSNSNHIYSGKNKKKLIYNQNVCNNGIEGPNSNNPNSKLNKNKSSSSVNNNSGSSGNNNKSKSNKGRYSDNDIKSFQLDNIYYDQDQFKSKLELKQEKEKESVLLEYIEQMNVSDDDNNYQSNQLLSGLYLDDDSMSALRFSNRQNKKKFNHSHKKSSNNNNNAGGNNIGGSDGTGCNNMDSDEEIDLDINPYKNKCRLQRIQNKNKSSKKKHYESKYSKKIDFVGGSYLCDPYEQPLEKVFSPPVLAKRVSFQSGKDEVFLISSSGELNKNNIINNNPHNINSYQQIVPENSSLSSSSSSSTTTTTTSNYSNSISKSEPKSKFSQLFENNNDSDYSDCREVIQISDDSQSDEDDIIHQHYQYDSDSNEEDDDSNQYSGEYDDSEEYDSEEYSEDGYENDHEFDEDSYEDLSYNGSESDYMDSEDDDQIKLELKISHIINGVEEDSYDDDDDDEDFNRPVSCYINSEPSGDELFINPFKQREVVEISDDYYSIDSESDFTDQEEVRKNSFSDWIKKVHGPFVSLPPKQNINNKSTVTTSTSTTTTTTTTSTSTSSNNLVSSEIIDLEAYDSFSKKTQNINEENLKIFKEAKKSLEDLYPYLIECTESQPTLKKEITELFDKNTSIQQYSVKQLTSIANLFDRLILHKYTNEIPLWPMSKMATHQIVFLAKQYEIFREIKKIKDRNSICLLVPSNIKKPSIKKKDTYILGSQVELGAYWLHDTLITSNSTSTTTIGGNSNNDIENSKKPAGLVGINKESSSSTSSPFGSYNGIYNRKGRKYGNGTITTKKIKRQQHHQHQHQQKKKKNNQSSSPNHHNHHKTSTTGIKHGDIVAENVQPISNANVGSSLLKKMGWLGGGLGATGQGLEEPIQAIVRKEKFGLGYS